MAKANKFEVVEKQNTKAIFRKLPGWKFDEGVWASENIENRNFRLPPKSDLDFSSTPAKYYKSGIAEPAALEFEEINFEDNRRLTGWTPAVRRGGYHSQKTPAQLHGSESLLLLVRNELDNDSRSFIDLEEKPYPFLPLTVEYLERDPITFAIKSSSTFSKVIAFKGVASNGRELDGNDASNTDTSVSEFKIINQSSDPILNERIDPNGLVEIQADVWEFNLTSPPVIWWKVGFSRPDIFKQELSFDTFLGRQVDPVANGPLIEGDYAIGYRGLWTEDLGVRVYLTADHTDYGTISYKPIYDSTLLFNKNVQIDREATFENADNDNVFFLPWFPVLDLSAYEDNELAGSLILDTGSLVLTVAVAEWTRTTDLSLHGPIGEVYELDPLYGTITFGDGVNGKIPVGEIVATYKQVPLIQYDTSGATELFADPREDLDPQMNSLKNGFLVLDNHRLIPYKIRISANGAVHTRADGSRCHGPLSVPAATETDLLVVRARVLGRGNPEVGVPNVPVQFESLDGLISFSQHFSVTDGDGYAYTEAQGSSHISEFIVSDEMYLPMDSDAVDYLNPDPGALVPYLPPWGAHLSSADTLVVPERFDDENVKDVYMLIKSVPSNTIDNLLDYDGDPLAPDDYLEPYNGKTRRGGLTVVWHTTESGSEVIVHPLSAVEHPGNPAWTLLTFPIDIPTGRLITSYKIVIDRSAMIRAKTIEDPLLVSGELEICLELNDAMKGQWKLPNLKAPNNVEFLENPPELSDFSGSRISSAVYLNPNDISVTELQPSGGGAPLAFVTTNDAVDIIGTSFPITAELAVSVFIIKVDEVKEIIAVKDITSEVTFIDATTIRILSFPTPPTGEYLVNYWIAVAGFHPEDSDGIRKTAIEIEIREAP